ncbi:ROK family protein [Streptomyces cavernae]|uniref:ROK family protein n=1 Tax=Streptomyces cavernae TaxID=2259034 RepID=UPI000FEC09D9|nr:ROK family protein [Streptomyces cavernae]
MRDHDPDPAGPRRPRHRACPQRPRGRSRAGPCRLARPRLLLDLPSANSRATSSRSRSRSLVLVDNDLIASTTAELIYGAGRVYDDFLGLGDGVGLGAVVDRRVYRGPGGLSGTFGNTPMSDTGVQCGCGARGCLETFTNDQGILREARRRGLATAATDMEEIRTRAIAGDQNLLVLLADIGAILGRALAGVVNLLGTPTIAVIGENYALWPGLEPGSAMPCARVRSPPRTG